MCPLRTFKLQPRAEIKIHENWKNNIEHQNTDQYQGLDILNTMKVTAFTGPYLDLLLNK